MSSVQQKIIFDKNLCNYFIDYFESDFCTNREDGGRYKTTGETATVSLTHIPKNIVDLLKPFNVQYINFTEEQNSTYCLKINKYYKGTSFPEHKDDAEVNYGSKDISRTKRWKTFIWQLSDERSYKGGDFLIEGVPVDRTQGNCICFDSNMTHSVTTLEEGVRYSMVLWLEKHNFSSNTSSLL